MSKTAKKLIASLCVLIAAFCTAVASVYAWFSGELNLRAIPVSFARVSASVTLTREDEAVLKTVACSEENTASLAAELSAGTYTLAVENASLTETAFEIIVGENTQSGRVSVTGDGSGACELPAASAAAIEIKTLARHERAAFEITVEGDAQLRVSVIFQFTAE